jgi:hypothetical protein
MRILVVGFPLPNPQFDNYNLLTSPSWFDYDGVIVDPESVSTVIEDVISHREEHFTRADEPIQNRPTNPLTVGLGDVIKRRRSEAARLLENGGVIGVFARPDVVHEGVAGFAGANRYAWLPAPAGMAWDELLIRADGTEVRVEDAAHPFGPVVGRNSRWIAYRARIDENLPGFATYGHVFARSAGGVAVGAELRVGNGRVVLLPAFGSVAFGDQRFELAGQMLEALRRSVGAGSETAPPQWIADVTLPGAEDLEQREREAREAREAAKSRLAETQAELGKFTRFRALLWQEGAFGLEPSVREAFRTIGFEVESDPDRPLWIADGAVRAFVEVESSTEAVKEWPYFRLQKRLQDDLLKTQEPKHGLIVVNGQRLTPLQNRTDQISATLRVMAENYRYGIITTERLFELVKYALSEPYDYSTNSVIRARILGAVGEVPADLLPRPEPQSEPVMADEPAAVEGGVATERAAADEPPAEPEESIDGDGLA